MVAPKTFSDALRTGLGERVVVYIAGRDNIIEARHIMAGHDLCEEVAEFHGIG